VGGIGVIDHPQPGQNAAFDGITVPQCGHFTEAGAGFAELLAGIFAVLSSDLFSGLFSVLLSELDNSASIPLLRIAAVFANPVDLKSVAGGDVVVLVSDLLLGLSHFFREKLDRSAALSADHMVMAAAIVLMFVTRDAVVKSDFAGQAATGQELQRSIDSGNADAWVGFFHQPVQFVDRKMFTRFEECPQDCAALFGLLQADAFEMPKENSFRFADVLARDGRLIVNSLLQHVGRRGVDQHAKGSGT